jgi:hypothetical protein
MINFLSAARKKSLISTSQGTRKPGRSGYEEKGGEGSGFIPTQEVLL